MSTISTAVACPRSSGCTRLVQVIMSGASPDNSLAVVNTPLATVTPQAAVAQPQSESAAENVVPRGGGSDARASLASAGQDVGGFPMNTPPRRPSTSARRARSRLCLH